MSTDDLKALAEEALELSEKATKGPWTQRGDLDRRTLWTPVNNGFLAVVGCYSQPGLGVNAHEANAAIIAAYRTSAPLLARALLAAMECIDKLRTEDLGADDAYIRDFDAALAGLEVKP